MGIYLPGNSLIYHGAPCGDNPIRTAWLLWIYIKTLTAGMGFVYKGGEGEGHFFIGADGTTASKLRFFTDHLTEDTEAISGSGILSANKWLCLAGNHRDTINLPQLFVGDETTPLAEVSSYFTRNYGTGSRAGDLGYASVIGQNEVGSLSDMVVGPFWWFSTNLGLTTLRQFQYVYHNAIGESTCKQILLPGLWGETDILDMSGNKNNATIDAGASEADWPRLPTSSMWWLGGGA